jgi:hypothetical protein
MHHKTMRSADGITGNGNITAVRTANARAPLLYAVLDEFLISSIEN